MHREQRQHRHRRCRRSSGVTRNADAKLNRSSRIGLGDGTIAPFGSATVNVIPS